MSLDTGATNSAFRKDEVFVYPCNNIQVNIQSQGYENSGTSLHWMEKRFGTVA